MDKKLDDIIAAIRHFTSQKLEAGSAPPPSRPLAPNPAPTGRTPDTNLEPIGEQEAEEGAT